MGPLHLVPVASLSIVLGSCSSSQGMICHSDIVAINLLSCITWVHSAHHGLRPCTRYPRGSIVAPMHEQGAHPLLIVSLPGLVALSLTTRSLVKGSLAWLVLSRLAPGYLTHACGRHGRTCTRRVGQRLGGPEPCSDIALSRSVLLSS